jgi:hypothetical protein
MFRGKYWISRALSATVVGHRVVVVRVFVKKAPGREVEPELRGAEGIQR